MATVAEWWGGLSEAGKGLSVLTAAFGAATALVVALNTYLGLPARVEEQAIEIQLHDTRIEVLEDAGLRRERGIAATNEKLDRVLCILEAQQAGTNALGCSR